MAFTSLAPRTGVGLGLRWDFIDELASGPLVAIDFIEVSPENYIGRGGYFSAGLARACERYPVITHGLTMSLGGLEPMDANYLRELASFIRRVESPWHSEHLCFSASPGRVFHDLMPLAFTEATARRVADRVRRAEDALGVPMAVENISYYLSPGKAQMGEAEFIARVCELANCGLMLDVNNAFVNCQNFGLDVDAWVRAIPLSRVVQIHVAGHEWFDDVHPDHDETTGGGPGVVLAGAAEAQKPGGEPGRVIVDTHGAAVASPVLSLLERVLVRTGPKPVLLERDQNVPAFPELLAEVARIREACDRAERARGATSRERFETPMAGGAPEGAAGAAGEA